MTFRMLSMDFDTLGTSNSYFRILANETVKYIVIAPGAMDAESLDDMPLDFVNLLPLLPWDDSSWTEAAISRSASGELVSRLLREPLKGVTNSWHPTVVDFRRLERVELLTALAEELKWASPEPGFDPNATVIGKKARFEWEIQYIQAETDMYKLLEGTGIGPRFLGHIHEQDRVIGFFLDKVAGRSAGIEDLEICTSALSRLHALGISHGDCNRYNFLIGDDGKVTLIDFEKCTVGASKEAMEVEIASLPKQLTEETGRGGGFTSMPDSDDESQD